MFNIYADSIQKFRNINVNNSGKLSSQSSDSEVDNVPTASTTDTPSQPTETVASNCPDRSQQFVAGETDSFNIYICETGAGEWQPLSNLKEIKKGVVYYQLKGAPNGQYYCLRSLFTFKGYQVCTKKGVKTRNS